MIDEARKKKKLHDSKIEQKKITDPAHGVKQQLLLLSALI